MSISVRCQCSLASEHRDDEIRTGQSKVLSKTPISERRLDRTIFVLGLTIVKERFARKAMIENERLKVRSETRRAVRVNVDDIKRDIHDTKSGVTIARIGPKAGTSPSPRGRCGVGCRIVASGRNCRRV